MPECYLTGDTIQAHKGDGNGQKSSLEHIIPNSLGGQMKSTTILSLEGNQKLNEDIDKDFNKIFTSWVSRLDLKRDRKNSQSFLSIHENYNIEIVYKGGKFFPKKPFYDENKKTIYANSIETGKNYMAHLLKQGVIVTSDDIRIFDDLAGKFKTPFNLNNKVFKRGFGKIAAGFAAKNGVSRSNMKDVIDLDNKCIKQRITLSPYLPTLPEEGFFEENKQKSQKYPIHSLVLCGDKKSRFLYCYVELFSAFQFYVLLDKDYDGEDIYEAYIYDLMSGKKIDYEDYAKSIPNSDGLFERLPSYRYIGRDRFVALTHVEKDRMSFFFHRNYHALEAFTNYYFISKKTESLGLEIA